MTLRKKSILIVAGTALALIAALSLAGRRIILDSALQVEAESLTTDLYRVVDALKMDVDHLDATAGDWAAWDDSYAFMADRAPGFLTANLSDEALRTLRVNLLAFVAEGGEIAAVKTLDLVAGGERADLVRSLAASIARDPRPWGARGRGLRGILALPEGNLLVAAREITRSDRSGTPRGAVVFARLLDADHLARIARITHLQAEILPLPDPRVPADVRAELRRGGDSPPAAIRPLGFRSVAGYTVLEDVFADASLALKVTELRAVYVQGVRSLSYFIGALLLAGLLFGATVTVLLERLVLSRLTRLSAAVREIGGARDLSRRVAVAGGDEIASLGAEVNGMLVQLQESEVALRRTRELLEDRVRERTAELETANESLRAQVAERARAEEELRALHEELERQNTELRTLDRMKDALIGDVSHELRTPVAKQAMQLELLRGELERRGMQGDLANVLLVMDGALRRQQSVIRNILTLSRLEAGGRGLHPEPVSLDVLIAEVADDYRVMLATCGIAVAVDVPPVTLHADRELLWHVFSNLVSNAVKYRGRVDPRVEVRAAREGGRVRVSIVDNGVGFAPETRERIFERFYQESAAVEGIGLGLHIVRTILDRIGGEVTIESPGKGLGTVAQVILPLAAGPA